jgi:hypothetical protein
MILIALALATGLGAAPGAPADTTRTIFGQWHFNKAASDDPHPYLGGQGDLSAAGYGPGTMAGPAGAPGGPPPGSVRSPSEAQKAARQELAALAIRAPERIELSERDGVLTFVGDSAAPITLRVGGPKVKWMTADSVRIETRAAWEIGRLVVEHAVHDAGKVSYAFYLSPNAAQLFIAVAVQPLGGPTRPVPFRRVYDPVAPDR